MNRKQRVDDLYEGVKPIMDADTFLLVIEKEPDLNVLSDLRDRFWNGTGEKPWQVKEINRYLTRIQKQPGDLAPGAKKVAAEPEKSAEESKGQSGRIAIFVALIAAFGGWGTAALTNWDKLSGKTPTAGGSPFVHYSVFRSNVTLDRCTSAAAEILLLDSPVKVEVPDKDGDIGETRLADFGSLTGWVSCVDMGESTLIYVGVSGSDYSDGKNKLHKLTTFAESRLPPAK